MRRIDRLWHRVRGHSCLNCRFAEHFRSNGDGQVTRVHLFCRGPDSVYRDGPAPPDRLCEAWAPGQPGGVPLVGNPDLTV